MVASSQCVNLLVATKTDHYKLDANYQTVYGILLVDLNVEARLFMT